MYTQNIYAHMQTLDELRKNGWKELKTAHGNLVTLEIALRIVASYLTRQKMGTWRMRKLKVGTKPIEKKKAKNKLPV